MPGPEADELAVAVARRHWMTLLWPIAWAVGVGALAGVVAFVAPGSWRSARDFGRVLVLGGAVLWLLLSWAALSEWVGTIYVVTPNRVIMRRGLLRRRIIEVATAQIGRCSVEQGILGRLLRYGTVRLELQNGSWWTMRRLGRPAEFVAGINAASGGGQGEG